MSPQQEATASSKSFLILGLKEFTKVVESTTRPRSSLSWFETTPSIQEVNRNMKYFNILRKRHLKNIKKSF